MTVAKKDSPWQLVSKYRRKLKTMARLRSRTEDWKQYPKLEKSPNQALADLEHVWRRVSSAESEALPPLFAEFRNQPGEEFGEHPLDALCVFIGQGHQPPPELLLALGCMYQVYLNGKGTLTLEECFFGKPKPKAGNHAARYARRFQELEWTIRLAVASSEMGDLRAAERIVAQDGLDIDPETVLRAVNKHSRKVKPEK